MEFFADRENQLLPLYAYRKQYHPRDGMFYRSEYAPARTVGENAAG